MLEVLCNSCGAQYLSSFTPCLSAHLIVVGVLHCYKYICLNAVNLSRTLSNSIEVLSFISDKGHACYCLESIRSRKPAAEPLVIELAQQESLNAVR